MPACTTCGGKPPLCNDCVNKSRSRSSRPPDPPRTICKICSKPFWSQGGGMFTGCRCPKAQLQGRITKGSPLPGFVLSAQCPKGHPMARDWKEHYKGQWMASTPVEETFFCRICDTAGDPSKFKVQVTLNVSVSISGRLEPC